MNPTYDFKGQVALVTGAAAGMGLATARAFAQSGAAVVLADRDGVRATQEAQKIVAEGGSAIGLTCDVSEEAQVAALIEKIVAQYGRLDMAFNNAGVMAKIAPTADATGEEFERVIGINLRGVWNCLKYELQQMQRQGSGAIVNNASMGAQVGNPGIASYIASKHGVVGLTRTAAKEYCKQGIRVNAVNPGAVDTQVARDVVGGDQAAFEAMGQGALLGRIGRPEEVAAAVLWLCSPAASYVVGAALAIDGGATA